MRLVPVGKPTFPDRQQDLQNAADASVTNECDGSVKVLDFGSRARIAFNGAATMTTAPLSYEQPIKAHYEEIFTRYLRRTSEPPPVGWQRVVLELPPDATRVDATEQDRFMEELLTLIRERCSATAPAKTSPQGFWIEQFDSSEIVNRYLRGGKLKVYAGSLVPQQMWIDVAPAAGAFAAGEIFRA